MIVFKNNSNSRPYKKFRAFYKKAANLNQKNIEAILVSSYSTSQKEVDSRFVNLKFIDDDKFIFFSNYQSPKSVQFLEHNQVSAVIFWNKPNVQIRIKAVIQKIPEIDSNNYFETRAIDKNALAISSHQSQKISSYSSVRKEYEQILNNKDLKTRPAYWGGYSFIPYYFEFWEGHDSRLNHRISFENNKGEWISSTLQP